MSETSLAKTLAVNKDGVFQCPCTDDGAVAGKVYIRLGKYTFWPCLRCFRQIEGLVMQAVLTSGAKMAVAENLAKQELLGGGKSMDEIKKELS